MGVDMRFAVRLFCCFAVLAALLAHDTRKALAAGYSYAHSAGEYSITLPEAPIATTIWADEQKVPYLENPPAYGAVGEVATFKRVDPESGDMFEIVITFLHADRDSLLSMTQERVEQILKDEYKDFPMEDKKISYSAGADTLKWATLTGFTVDEHNSLFYNAAHLLTGLESFYVIKIRYSAENKMFQTYFKEVTDSIKFTGR